MKMQISDNWKLHAHVLRRPLQLARVLNTCEQYRAEEAWKKKEEKREKKKKEREADEKEAEKRNSEKKEAEKKEAEKKDSGKSEKKDGGAASEQKDKKDVKKKKKDKRSDVEKDLRAIAWKRKKIVITAIACLFLLLIGALFGNMKVDTEGMSDVFKTLLLMDILLILVFYSREIYNKLYGEKELLPILTMPFTPLEIAMARFFQLVGKPMGIIAPTLIPVWMGYSLATGLGKGLTMATFFGIVFVPVFVLMTIFVATILIHTWLHNLMPKNPTWSVGIPAAVFVAFVAVMLVLDFFIRDSVPMKILNGFANAFAFNIALRRMVRGETILPIIFILVGMALMAVVFVMVVRTLYQHSLLSRGNLADDRDVKEVNSDVMAAPDNWFVTCVRKEVLAIWGQRAYRRSMILPWIVMPVLVVLSFVLLESFIPTLHMDKAMPANQVVSMLFCFITPLSTLSGLVNKAAGTVFSRDAYGLEQMILLPVDWDLQMGAKLVAACLCCAPGTIPGTLVLTFAYVIMGKLPWWGIPAGLIMAVPAFIWAGEYQMMQDIRKPFLKWKALRHLLRRQGEKVLLIPVLGNLVIPVILGMILLLIPGTLSHCLAVLLAYILVFPVFGGLWLSIFSVKRAESMARGELDPDKKEGFQEKLHKRLSKHL